MKSAFPTPRVFAAFLCAWAILASDSGAAQARVQENVVYGMYSGLALLMDVHYPSEPNGHGVLFIRGSGFHAPLGLDARPLKAARDERMTSLVDAGYTVFAINHRAAPRFRYPAAHQDAIRAMRFVRHHAQDFGITADRIGAVGSSSGGTLALALGVIDDFPPATDTSAVGKTSSKAQAVVALAAPTDLALMINSWEGAVDLVASYMGAPVYSDTGEGGLETELERDYRMASPISHVDRNDAPCLLVHGDKDIVVPFAQSEAFADAMQDAGGTVRLLRVPGGGHRLPPRAEGPEAMQLLEAMIDWLDLYLRQ
ncbi:MAG: prolyl oligopeptidase family serine peptidase [Gammaproteobacteria bacterium]|nr:prolyl oligopeptidase family serine peptidase [Gammaproteobacteria bacterium]MYF59062.1 prolyl oligopeptidase family serine peptidase [Gammaproteobacteria bacterium]